MKSLNRGKLGPQWTPEQILAELVRAHGVRHILAVLLIVIPAREERWKNLLECALESHGQT